MFICWRVFRHHTQSIFKNFESVWASLVKPAAKKKDDYDISSLSIRCNRSEIIQSQAITSSRPTAQLPVPGSQSRALNSKWCCTSVSLARNELQQELAMEAAA